MRNFQPHFLVYRGEVFEFRPAPLFFEQRHNTYVALAVSVASLGIEGGMMASGAGQPTEPNLAASSAQLANVQAELLPIQRQLEAAAQQGTSVTVNMPKHTALVDGKTVHVPAGPQTFDFSGYGAGQVQAKLAESMAQVQLALSQKYDSQFINQALQQEQQADPQGFAARQQMNDLVQQQINRPLNEPVADTLNQQIQQELTAAKSGTLDPQMQSVLMQGGKDALAARGGSGPGNTPDFAQPLTTGSAETQRMLSAIGAGTGELASGETPEDIQYRQEQQNLANLSSFMNGQTPESEFKSISGAQQGPTPFNPGQALPELPNNGNGAQSAALQSWQTQLGAAENQTNPWMAGLSSLLGVGTAGVKAGVI